MRKATQRVAFADRTGLTLSLSYFHQNRKYIEKGLILLHLGVFHFRSKNRLM